MLLVHIAGHADLGAPSPRNDPDNIGSLRAEELKKCTTPPEVTRRLFDVDFDQGSHRDDTNSRPPLHSGSALQKELRAISLHASGKSREESTEVLIIGVEGGDTPTDGLARTLVDALRIASSEAADLAGTRKIIIHNVCILPSLAVSSESITRLERRIGAYDGHVLLAMAGGATAVLAEAAGVAAATHQDEWSLVLVDRIEEGTGGQDLPLVPMSVNADPLRGWLMGLGLPTVLDDIYEQSDRIDTEVKKAADAVRRVMGELDSEPSAEDFAQVLQADVARGDLAAGMTLRAWILAKYKHLRDTHSYTDTSYKQSNKHLRQELGKVIGRLQEGAKAHPLEEPESWLAAQCDLNDLGKYATHNLESPSRDLTSSSLQEQVRREVGEPPKWLSVPSNDVCLLTAQGKVSHHHPLPSDADEPTGIERKPIITSLLTSEPSDTVRQACAVPEPFMLSAFIACSNSSVSEGRRIKEEIKHGDHLASDSPWNLDETSVDVHDYGESITQSGVSSGTISSTMEELSRTAEHWLEERATRPRAVVVTVLGEKAAVISLLRAAQTFGARHGVPVFLLSMVNSKDAEAGESREAVQVHQLGLDRDVRQALLKATAYCLDRFDLLTASRLLTLGDPAMEALSHEAIDLAKQLSEAVRAQNLDNFTRVILGTMSAAASLMDQIPPDAQVRLAAIVAELIRPPSGRFKGPDFKEPAILSRSGSNSSDGTRRTSHTDDLDRENASILLNLLNSTRNKLPVAHGRKALTEAVRHTISGYKQRDSYTYADLLRCTISAVEREHGVYPSDWGTRLQSLRDQVEALGRTGYGEKP